MKTAQLILLLIFLNLSMMAQKKFEKDVFETKKGNVEISFIGHGSLMIEYNKKTIHIDPFSRVADYSILPKADLVLITHDHGDHLDMRALVHVLKESTTVVMPEKCKEKVDSVKNIVVLKNGEKEKILGLKIKAVPAYNIKHKRENGDFFHPKGNGNGYVLNIAGKNIYIAGDTENTAEMKALKKVDIAFLPMNLPYTMTPEMVADAAKAFKPKILYPYHYGETDTNKLVELLKNDKSIEVRIRKM